MLSPLPPPVSLTSLGGTTRSRHVNYQGSKDLQNHPFTHSRLKQEPVVGEMHYLLIIFHVVTRILNMKFQTTFVFHDVFKLKPRRWLLHKSIYFIRLDQNSTGESSENENFIFNHSKEIGRRRLISSSNLVFHFLCELWELWNPRHFPRKTVILLLSGEKCLWFKFCPSFKLLRVPSCLEWWV